MPRPVLVVNGNASFSASLKALPACSPRCTNMSENTAFDAPTKLWTHSSPQDTQIYAFKDQIAQKYKLTLPTYQALWQWSVDHPASFWEEIWHHTGIVEAKSYNSV
jgi:acetoacetyl-CoA synthetase